MYNVKVMNADGGHELYPCQHISLTPIMEPHETEPGFKVGGKRVGLTIELSTGRQINLPEDTRLVYLENSHGSTINTYRWEDE